MSDGSGMKIVVAGLTELQFRELESKLPGGYIERVDPSASFSHAEPGRVTAVLVGSALACALIASICLRTVNEEETTLSITTIEGEKTQKVEFSRRSYAAAAPNKDVLAELRRLFDLSPEILRQLVTKE